MVVLIEAGVAMFAHRRQNLLDAVRVLSRESNQFQNNYPFELDNVQSVLKGLIQDCLSNHKT